MRIKPFLLERYCAQHEFTVPLSLSSSDCDGWAMSELLQLADDETRDLWEELRLGYTQTLGLPLLRAEIARLYRGIDADDVIFVTPAEGIFLAMNCLLEKGDHVVCTFPGYQSLYQIARSIGCNVSRWQADEARGWRFDPKDLQRLIRPQTRLVVLNFPHNPTGYMPSPEDFQEMMAIAEHHGARVFSDEMYRLLQWPPQSGLPSAVELSDQAVALFGMSKTFGLAGLRLGWLVVRDADLRGRLAAFKDYTTLCASGPSEILALIA